MEPEWTENGARLHFCKRAHERIGPDINAWALWAEIQKAVLEGNEDYARFRCSTARDRAIYRVHVAGQDWFVAVSKHDGRPITVLPRDHPVYEPGFRARTKKPKKPPNSTRRPAWVTHGEWKRMRDGKPRRR